MICFKWFYNNEKIRHTQAVLRIPTGFAPTYDLPGHLWETLGAICHTTRLMCVFKIVADVCCFCHIIIIHTYHWTCNRIAGTISILKNLVVWPSTARKSLSYLNGNKGIQPVEFFCTIWRGFKFKTPFNRRLYTIEKKLWVSHLTLFT